jgi:hypothetical protein
MNGLYQKVPWRWLLCRDRNFTFPRSRLVNLWAANRRLALAGDSLKSAEHPFRTTPLFQVPVLIFIQHLAAHPATANP